MKLVRYGQPGREKAGILDQDGRVRDLSGIHADITPELLAPEALSRLRGIAPESLPLVDEGERIGPCLTGTSKVVCIGLNYRDHARETGKPIPSEPVVFMKATTSISGPYDDVVLPKGAEKGDWEVELGLVIGQKAQYVAEEDWQRYVAGYCVVNDVSERAFQVERGGQWVKGKSSDTFCPLGPWLVTADEVADPQNLELTAEVSGEIMQAGSTSEMIFDCAHVVAYLSRFMTLLPGDVIATGTPAGVGFARNRFLKPGDSLRLSVAGLGEQRQQVVAHEDRRS
ncbi:fumarylacetoacetate hydrolase family protein [Streptomyces monashensis]|uniref:2-hydroxyhepta-2,4-diene-1,7-dioate isomerase n=1 Tax=Streptomyces monashensis TaxID=1678012 RepID=A0A1S2PVW6_9ACTN|nr:fumarylacetoacetate hydrolase family protein [Streptomyces monashensis]OIJ97034.1 2-hydroxyhepta-2,4-diene-1,7-dioate isomerase [Streptomyces monashensis]